MHYQNPIQTELALLQPAMGCTALFVSHNETNCLHKAKTSSGAGW
jgi:hypothetical protein